jgi:hypothetical protein
MDIMKKNCKRLRTLLSIIMQIGKVIELNLQKITLKN